MHDHDYMVTPTNNVEQKKLAINEYIQCASVYIKFKNMI